MVVRELTGGKELWVVTNKERENLSQIIFNLLTWNGSGIYFGEPKGFGKNSKGEQIAFNTEVYSTSEVCGVILVVYFLSAT